MIQKRHLYYKSSNLLRHASTLTDLDVGGAGVLERGDQCRLVGPPRIQEKEKERGMPPKGPKGSFGTDPNTRRYIEPNNTGTPFV